MSTTASVPPADGRRKLLGSWLDWIGSLPKGSKPPHHLDDPRQILESARDVRNLTGQFGPDSAVSHRAQAAFLAAAKPEELFGLLALAADAALGELEGTEEL